MNHLQIILTKQHHKKDLLKLFSLYDKQQTEMCLSKKQLTIEFLPPTSSQKF